MGDGDPQRYEPGRRQRVGQAVGDEDLAQGALDAELPGCHRREEHLLRCHEVFTTPRSDVGVVVEPPQSDMAVEQQPHAGPAAADSSKRTFTASSGPTTSARYSTRPAHAPGRRTGRTGGQGMIFATAVPSRARM